MSPLKTTSGPPMLPDSKKLEKQRDTDGMKICLEQNSYISTSGIDLASEPDFPPILISPFVKLFPVWHLGWPRPGLQQTYAYPHLPYLNSKRLLRKILNLGTYSQYSSQQPFVFFSFLIINFFPKHLLVSIRCFLSCQSKMLIGFCLSISSYTQKKGPKQHTQGSYLALRNLAPLGVLFWHYPLVPPTLKGAKMVPL